MDLSFIGGLAQAGASIYDTEKNEETAEDNLNFQKDVFAQNQKNWETNFDYQKALQERIFDREDTSYQRTVNDMRQAGLNPLAMNGTNGSGEAIATSPLQQEAPQSQKISNTAKIMGDIIGTMNGIQNYQVGISYGKEQEAKAQQAQTQAFIDQLTAFDKIESSSIDRKTKEELFKDFTRNMEFNKDLNIFNGMDNNSRDTRIMQALNSSNKEIQDFATNYMLNGIQYNGLKIGTMANGVVNKMIDEDTKNDFNRIKDGFKEVGEELKSENNWKSIKDYYQKNWNEYGWKTWKYHEW